MISSAIWDKSAQENFSKTSEIARARRASAICSLWKFTYVDLSQIALEIYPILHEKNHVITLHWKWISNVFGRFPFRLLVKTLWSCQAL